MNEFEYTFPDWESWLDGNVHEIPLPHTGKALNRFRSALRARADRKLLSLRTKTVFRTAGYCRLRIQAY